MGIAAFHSHEGQSVFVTGGASGIGASIVECFIGAGANVAFNDIDETSGKALAKKLGDGCLFLPADASDPEQLKNSLETGIEHFGGLNTLVNNVARDSRETVAEITPKSWRDNLALNLDPVMFAAQAVLPAFHAAGGGAIINMSSLNAIIGLPDLPTYSTAKAAIMGLTKTLANSLGENNIRVNAILPGWVITERQKKLWLTREAEAEWKADCALKGDLLPEDVANLVLFLASDAAKMITSQSFIIDAGYR